MEGTDNLLTDPEMMKLTQNPDTKFDVVMTSFIPTSEVAYFLAHRFGAQLVLYCSAQGRNSIALLKSQQTFQQSFYSSVGHPVVLETLLKTLLKSLLRFQQSY